MLEPRQSTVDFVQTSFVCVIVPFSLPLQTIPSIVVLSSRVRQGLVADVFVYSRSRYLESDHSMATIFLQKTVLFIANSNTVRENIIFKVDTNKIK